MTANHQSLLEQGRAIATSRSMTVWLCTPRHGRPFLALTPESVPPNLEALLTIQPATT